MVWNRFIKLSWLGAVKMSAKYILNVALAGVLCAQAAILLIAINLAVDL